MDAVGSIHSTNAYIQTLDLVRVQRFGVFYALFRALLIKGIKIGMQSLGQVFPHELCLYLSVDVELELIGLAVFLHCDYKVFIGLR